MNGFDVLEIGTPPFISLVVGMTDIMPDLVAFATDATYLEPLLLLSFQMVFLIIKIYLLAHCEF